MKHNHISEEEKIKRHYKKKEDLLKCSRKKNEENFTKMVDNVKNKVGDLMTEKGDKIINEIIERNKDDKFVEFVDNLRVWTPSNIPTKEVMKPMSTSIQGDREHRYISPEEMNEFAKELAEKISPTYCEYPLNKTKEEDKPCEKPKTFDELCQGIMDLHRRKNTDYGNAFHELYQKFGPLSYVYPRLFEKLKRVESLLVNKDKEGTKNGALVADEKISDTLLDIATYCIMTVEEMQY